MRSLPTKSGLVLVLGALALLSTGLFTFNGEAANTDSILVTGKNLGTNAWWLIRTLEFSTFTDHIRVANLKVSATWGSAVISYGAIESTYENLHLYGWNGLELDNNSFLAKVENVYVLYSGRFGIKQEAGTGVVHVDRVEIFGGGDGGADPWSMSYFMSGSSLLMSNTYLSAVRWGLFAIGVSGQASVNMSFVVLTDEGAAGLADIDSGLYLEDILSVSATGCTFEVKKYPTTIVKAAGNTRAVWLGSVFTANTTATKIFQTVGLSPSVSHTCMECNRWSSDGGATEAQVPWGDNVGVMRAGVLQ